jgi:hypothetical protein
MAAVTNAKLLKAIQDADGNLSAVARAVHCSRSTVYRRIEKSPELQTAVEEAQEALTDEAESQLATAIRAGNMTAIIFHLQGSKSGRNRGYGSKSQTEVTGPNGGPLKIEVAWVDHADEDGA